MSSYLGTHTEATPAAEPAPVPDQRIVTIDVDDMGALALGELAELGELTGMPLDELRYKLRPPDGSSPDPKDVIRLALALAVVIERRTDITLELADARRWDIRLVTGTAGPKARARRTRARSSRG